MELSKRELVRLEALKIAKLQKGGKVRGNTMQKAPKKANKDNFFEHTYNGKSYKVMEELGIDGNYQTVAIDSEGKRADAETSKMIETDYYKDSGLGDPAVVERTAFYLGQERLGKKLEAMMAAVEKKAEKKAETKKAEELPVSPEEIGFQAPTKPEKKEALIELPGDKTWIYKVVQDGDDVQALTARRTNPNQWADITNNEIAMEIINFAAKQQTSSNPGQLSNKAQTYINSVK